MKVGTNFVIIMVFQNIHQLFQDQYINHYSAESTALFCSYEQIFNPILNWLIVTKWLIIVKLMVKKCFESSLLLKDKLRDHPDYQKYHDLFFLQQISVQNHQFPEEPNSTTTIFLHCIIPMQFLFFIWFMLVCMLEFNNVLDSKNKLLQTS